ncbi:hypothetical protein EC917_101341 [Bacillus thuringiensis]|uniref:Uncharacterized protein n=1 Tax=Bacillus thuringiensis TaxID=1428 RepID=A0A4R4BK58_BACTU|nr:hypothetical protein [Bacillus thuringiensis]TCW59087.1 hypothetical protein EC917_101341 [Bacillus thuringiensis]TCW59673.1 hypothetical protein EC910_101303 [Bacillus thuringiensis]
MKDFEKRIFEEVKFKKRIEYLTNLAIENQELKEIVKSLSTTVEDLKRKVDILSVQVSESNSADNILGTLEYALTRVREYELMEGDE